MASKKSKVEITKPRWFEQDPLPTVPKTIRDFYNLPPFDELFDEEIDFEEDEPNWGKPEMIPTLLAMARDIQLKDTIAQGNALDALTTITTGWGEEDIQELLLLFNREENEWLFETLYSFIPKLGSIAAIPLMEFTSDTDYPRSDYGHNVALDTLEQIIEQPNFDESLKPVLVKEFNKRLENYHLRSADRNTPIVGILMALGDKSSLPIIREAFKAGVIDKKVYGPYKEVESEFGIPKSIRYQTTETDLYLNSKIMGETYIMQHKWEEAAIEYMKAITYSNDIICEKESQSLANIFTHLKRYNDAKSYLALIRFRFPASQWNELTKLDNIAPIALPDRQYRIRSLDNLTKTKTTFGRIHKHSEFEDPLIAFTDSYFIWSNSCYSLAWTPSNFPKKESVIPFVDNEHITCFAVHGNTVATGGPENIYLYDIASGKLIESYSGLRGPARTMALTSTHLVAATDTQHLVWTRHSKSEPIELYGLKEATCKVAVDSKSVMVAGDVVREYDIHTGKYLGAFVSEGAVPSGTDRYRSFYVKFNENYVVVGAINEIAVFYRPNKKCIRIPLRKPPTAIALCGDIMAFNNENNIDIWDIPAKSRLVQFKQKDVIDLHLKVDMKVLELNYALENYSGCSMKWTTELKKVSEECSKCKKEMESLKKCGRCRNVSYCSVECQKQDWDVHKYFCPAKQ